MSNQAGKIIPTAGQFVQRPTLVETSGDTLFNMYMYDCLNYFCIPPIYPWHGTSNFMLPLTEGASAPGSSPGLGHCVVFLGKTLHPHSASLHPGV